MFPRPQNGWNLSNTDQLIQVKQTYIFIFLPIITCIQRTFLVYNEVKVELLSARKTTILEVFTKPKC